VTEFYLYAEGGRVMGEVENVGPVLSRGLVVDLPAGTFQGACKPGMVGDGIRQDISVTGEPAQQLSDSAELEAAAESNSRYVQSQTGALIEMNRTGLVGVSGLPQVQRSRDSLDLMPR